jgi:hypothetical protein
MTEQTTPFSAATDIGISEANPGERCQFHPGCCEPEDTTCPGSCTNPAIKAITFRRQHESFPARRAAFCNEHAPYVADGIIELLARQRMTQN